MLFINSNANEIWFYNWWNRNHMEFWEKNMCGYINKHRIQEANEIVNKKKPTKILENNSAWVAQLKESYIKNEAHLSKIFLIHTRVREKSRSRHRICPVIRQSGWLIYKGYSHYNIPKTTYMVSEWDVCVAYKENIQEKTMPMYLFFLVMIFIPINFSWQDF